MNRSPEISVIIPLYNKGSYVVRAVRSALAQQPAPTEILVVDDGSTDEGPDLLLHMPEHSRIRIVRQENAGEGAARNRGLMAMQGTLAAFLDADDEWLPGHLRNIGELVRTFPCAGLFATGYQSVYSRGVRVETAVAENRPVLLRDYFETARGGFCLHISSCAVWKSAALEAGGFAEREPLGADLEFFARVAMGHSVALHPAVSGVYYAAHSGSAIHAHSWSPRHPPVVRLLRSGATMPLRTQAMRDYADWILQEHALTGLCLGNRSEAAVLLSEVTRLVPFSFPWFARLAAIGIPQSVLRTLIRLRRSRFAITNRTGQPPIFNRVVPDHA